MRTDENELNFRDFSNRLLAAEETVHRSGTVALYSPEALQKILSTFCNIVAGDLEAQSCTIQLKLHDLRSCKFIDDLTRDDSMPGLDYDAAKRDGWTQRELKHIAAYQRRTAAGFRETWKGAEGKLRPPKGPPEDGKEYATRRDSTLRSPNAFPYGIYPKGAMWLLAANEKSPWKPFVGWLITDLKQGVTAQIVQEKSARVRDPYSMRKTRAYRKLGPVDPCLWTNGRPKGPPAGASPRYFFNYYAVPIRIHAGGDVIGVIKIENKGFAHPEAKVAHLHDILSEVVKCKHSTNYDDMLDNLSDILGPAEATVKERGFLQHKRSLLALVYLANDLSKYSPADGTIEPLLTAHYLEPSAACTDAANTRPPVQVLFDSIVEEDAFFNGPAPKAPSQRPKLRVVSDFYRGLDSRMATRSSNVLLQDYLKRTVTELVARSWKADVEVERVGDKSFPDFFYKVIGSQNGKEVFHFHVQVCPSIDESEKARPLAAHWGLPLPRAKSYAEQRPNQKPGAALNGEYIDPSAPPLVPGAAPSADRIIHFRTDRLAARTQALTYAFPAPAFSATDSWKLSWAALEIGKLIERQISYRGTHAAPVVPLTADDFFRIPISDLSFVDAVRQQHEHAETARNALHYHIPNLCRDLGFTWGITHVDRVKGLRSYFDRIGQAHRAHYDALVAIWLYMLARKIKKTELKAIGKRSFTDLLPQLRQEIETLGSTDPAIKTRFVKWRKGLRRWLSNDELVPDLRFGAPALDLAPGLRKKALQRLRDNLVNCPNGLREHKSTEPFTDGELVELLYRRYDAFVTLAISLYLQLKNQEQEEEYLDFYENSRAILAYLRTRLESLEEQVTRAPQEKSPIVELSETLGKLRVEVLSLPTRELAEILHAGDPGPAEVLRFSVHGIYKRIRTLANVTGNQWSPAMLNWEGERFDYLGGRLNCLFKNQVFAVYEEVWSRGDPFRPILKSASTRGGSPARQRWLCLRTRVHAGNDGYYAWQVAALIDPIAISDNFWDENAYTLNTLREILTAAYRHWHDDWETYEQLAEVRGALQKRYREWFSFATKVLDREPASRPPEPLFGQYLGEAPLDLLVHVLRRDAKVGQKEGYVVEWKDLRQISAILDDFTQAALSYSQKTVLPVLRGMERASYAPADGALLTSAKKLYEWVRRLIESKAGITDEVRESGKKMADEEAMFRRSAKTAEAPIVFINEAVARKVTNQRTWFDCVHKPNENARVGRADLEDVLCQIQGSQMDYLFDLPPHREAPPLRGQAEVMDRILCYVLLHNRNANNREVDAYNLFYYVMSLVPVEIQVRTALADTMAEQYHKIYKIGTDPLSATMIPRERLKGIGQELDGMDRELEVQFEDYIAHKAERASK